MTNSPASQFLYFADSEIASITADGGGVRILFSAAHLLHHEPENNNKPAEGYARGVELVLTGTHSKASLENFMGRVSFGRAMMEGKWLSQLPLPCTMPGHITVEFDFANQSHIEIEASGLECRFTGEPNFFESMAC